MTFQRLQKSIIEQKPSTIRVCCLQHFKMRNDNYRKKKAKYCKGVLPSTFQCVGGWGMNSANKFKEKTIK